MVCRKNDRKRFPMSSAARVLPSGHLLGRDCKCRKRFNARGAGGGSPRRNKVKVSPFPPGRGAEGDGGKNKAKGGVGGRPKPPRPPTRHHGGRASRRQRRQATPAGTANAPPNQCRAGARPPAPHRAPPLFCHRPPPIKNSGKVLGGLGASFKKPPTHLCPRRLFPPLPCPRRL